MTELKIVKFVFDVLKKEEIIFTSGTTHSINIVSNGTENHMFLVDLIEKGITGKDADIVSKKENKSWLFDTSVDPLEKNNLIESHPKEAQKIEELLVQFNFEQKEPLFPSAFEAPIMIDKYDGQAYEEGDEYIYWSN